MTQAQLAAVASVGANYVPRLERGEMTASVDAAYRIARALGASVDDLCGALVNRDAIQDAARALLALSDGDMTAFNRAIQAVEQLRAELWLPPPSTDEGAETEAPTLAEPPRRPARRPPKATPRDEP